MLFVIIQITISNTTYISLLNKQKQHARAHINNIFTYLSFQLIKPKSLTKSLLLDENIQISLTNLLLDENIQISLTKSLLNENIQISLTKSLLDENIQISLTKSLLDENIQYP